jgi:hypothetical protein
MGNDEVCPACCEGFQSSWDDDKQSWMLSGGIRSDEDGHAYHSGCYVAPGEHSDVTSGAEQEDELEEVAAPTPTVRAESALANDYIVDCGQNQLGLDSTCSSGVASLSVPAATEEEAGVERQALGHVLKRSTKEAGIDHEELHVTAKKARLSPLPG